MEVVPLSPMPVWASVWSNAAERVFATIVCKATFEVKLGTLDLAAEQLALIHRDSAYAPSDLAPFKPRADVAVVGCVHTPPGHTASTIEAGFAVGGLEKRVQIDVSQHERPIPTSAFAPLTPASAERRALLGRHAGRFDHEQWFMKPLPADLDPAFFNSAPPDQRLDRIAADTRVVLRHFHPDHAELTCQLPDHVPFVFIERKVGVQTLSMVCDALWIDTDDRICSLTWRSQLALEDRDEPIRALVSFGPRASPLTYEAVDRKRKALGLRPLGDLIDGTGGVATMKITRGSKLPDATVSLDELVANVVLPFLRRADSVPPPPIPLEPSLSSGTTELSRIVASVMDRRAPAPERVDPVAAPPIAAPRLESSPWTGSPRRHQVLVSPGYTTKHDPQPLAARDGVAAASDAARRRTTAAEDTREGNGDDGVKTKSQAFQQVAAVDAEPVRLVWFEHTAVAAIRKRWRRIVTEHDLRPLSPGDDLDGDAGDPEILDQSRVHEVLTRADRVNAERLSKVIAGAIDKSGRFVPPLVAIDGTLTLPFDEVEELRATTTAMTPFTPGDKKLGEQIEAAVELLRLDYLEGAGDVARSLTERLHDTFARATRGTTPERLATHVARMLLERRRHQTRRLWGTSWLRGILTAAGAGDQLPAYLPAAIAGALPLFRCFAVRLLAEVEHRQDETEHSPTALRVVALATLPQRQKVIASSL